MGVVMGDAAKGKNESAGSESGSLSELLRVAIGCGTATPSSFGQDKTVEVSVVEAEEERWCAMEMKSTRAVVFVGVA